MRFFLAVVLLWLGCGVERPPLQVAAVDDEPVFAHDTFADAGF